MFPSVQKCDEWRTQNTDEKGKNMQGITAGAVKVVNSDKSSFNICSPNISAMMKETLDHSQLVKEFDDLLFELSSNKCNSKLPINEFDCLSVCCDSSYAENCKYVPKDENIPEKNLKSGIILKQKDKNFNLKISAHDIGIEKTLKMDYKTPSISKNVCDDVKCNSDVSQVGSKKLLDTCNMYHNDKESSHPVIIDDIAAPVESDNLHWINSVLWDYQESSSSSNQKEAIIFGIQKQDKIHNSYQEDVNNDKKTVSNVLESSLMKSHLNESMFVGEFSDVIPMTRCVIKGSSKFKEKHIPPYMYKKQPMGVYRVSELVCPDSLKSSYQKRARELEMSNSMKCFLVNLYIEAKDRHSGPFLFEIYPKMTLRLLKLKVEQEYDIAVSAQMWILGRTLAVDNDMSLYHYGVLPGSPIFLYVDSAYKMPVHKIPHKPVSEPAVNRRESSINVTIIDKVSNKTEGKSINKSKRIPFEVKKHKKDRNISKKLLEPLQDQVCHAKSKQIKSENISNASESTKKLNQNLYLAELEPIINLDALKNNSQNKDESISQLLSETDQNKDYVLLSEVDRSVCHELLQLKENKSNEIQSEPEEAMNSGLHSAKREKNVNISNSEKVFFQNPENNDLENNTVSSNSFDIFENNFELSDSKQDYLRNQIFAENFPQNFQDAEHQEVSDFSEKKLGCEIMSVNSVQPTAKAKSDKISILRRLSLKHRRKSKETEIDEVLNSNSEVLMASSLNDTVAENIQLENDCSTKFIEIVNAPCQDGKIHEDTKEQCNSVSEESAKNYESLLETENMDLVKNSVPFMCPVCFSDIGTSQGVILHDCLHSFCQDCLARTVEYSESTLIKCPYRDDDYSCQSYLQQREIKALVSKDMYEKYLRRSITTAESLAEKSFHCKTPDCPGWCMFEDNINVFHCPVCHHYNCLNCRAVHEGFNCRQYQNRLKCQEKFDRDSEKTLEFLNKMIDDGKAMKCPKCDLILMKKWGCDWLKCSICHTEICWITKGPRWGPAGQGDTSAGCRCGVNGSKCHPSCTYCH
ncbi:uncharacterized protein LOC118188033 isoform X2 [Stegodyphus dumicola]|nr:uncharacterized protein LOC118188033 isoform X2 [Stegodyphus dumicola]XP_035214261.1 uncharacterized protein LOC118188033 isoform X2 [Stegodyphus dumicola]XP_035214262.1 uncharacterized protein LOC118188033 isoform X2 [Stegodyphus dumicola]XP_035214263.1 uncharacterized protein LOC118188033 isoform X2 [Stegodyphus dumicola]XP_035214264.1 uncharacterized protein LOC118188033 isoform X2 [Stegodyphus dumicola]